VCPNGATISFETGVVYKRERRSIQHIGYKTRCASCHGRFKFNEFLRTSFLEADAGQKVCSHKSCVKPTWEGSKFCRAHFLSWTPDLLGEDTIAMAELRNLFSKAATEQWLPTSPTMAKIMKRVGFDGTDLPASEIVNIDLEFSICSREVLQIGLADLESRRSESAGLSYEI
jgi:hypothetical protein